MKLSTKGRYGVRAMFNLALYGGENTVSLKTVAQREQISEKYLEHLFASLRKAGLITSVRGAQGGYRLALPPEEITLGDIVRVLEGPVAPTECVIKGNETKKCDRASQCIMRHVWARIRDEIDATLDSITLAEIVEEQKKLIEQGYMYYI